MLWVITSKLGARDHVSAGSELSFHYRLEIDEAGELESSLPELLTVERKRGSLHDALKGLEHVLTSLCINVGGGSAEVLVLDAEVGVGKFYSGRVRV